MHIDSYCAYNNIFINWWFVVAIYTYCAYNIIAHSNISICTLLPVQTSLLRIIIFRCVHPYQYKYSTITNLWDYHYLSFFSTDIYKYILFFSYFKNILYYKVCVLCPTWNLVLLVIVSIIIKGIGEWWPYLPYLLLSQVPVLKGKRTQVTLSIHIVVDLVREW